MEAWNPLDDAPPPDYEPPKVWTPEHVELTFIAALKVLSDIPDRIGPKEFGSAMPSYVYDRADLNAQAETPDVEGVRNDISEALRETYDRKNRSRRQHTAYEITAMEKAIAWLFLLRPDERHLRSAFAVACACKAREKDFNAACRRRGWAYSTARRRKVEAATRIARRLIEKQVAVF